MPNDYSYLNSIDWDRLNKGLKMIEAKRQRDLSYKERQRTWLKENKIVMGQSLHVFKIVNGNGWKGGVNSHMIALVGKSAVVTNVDDVSGLCLTWMSEFDGYHYSYWFSYECFIPESQTEIDKIFKRKITLDNNK